MPPLEDRYIEQALTVEVDGVAVDALVRANWGAAEVSVNGVTVARDRRAWAFALLAAGKPEARYAFEGRLTPRGLEVAREMISALVRSPTPDDPIIVDA